MNPPPDIAQSKVFELRAMNTLFRIRLPDSRDAAAVAPAIGACFVEVERLEQLLSRYIADSDVSRINALAAGESLFIHEDTHALLLDALSLHTLTGGLFDVTLGAQSLHRQLCGDSEPPPPLGSAGFSIDPDRPMVTRISAGRDLDFGGIGKGFALDRLATILDEHGVAGALLQAGSSTILAQGLRPWNISMESSGPSQELPLREAAISTSGTGIQGSHILLPDGTVPHILPWPRVRVMTRRATDADALSTACLLMNEPQLRDFATHNHTLRIWVERNDGRVKEITGSAPGI